MDKKRKIKTIQTIKNQRNMNKEFTIPKDIEADAKVYIENVLSKLESSGMLENVDNAALTMLARNYSMFIKASKQLERLAGCLLKSN